MVEEKHIYEIVGFSKDDARYRKDNSHRSVGKRVILGRGLWIGPWWSGVTEFLDPGNCFMTEITNVRVKLRRIKDA